MRAWHATGMRRAVRRCGCAGPGGRLTPAAGGRPRRSGAARFGTDQRERSAAAARREAALSARVPAFARGIPSRRRSSGRQRPARSPFRQLNGRLRHSPPRRACMRPIARGIGYDSAATLAQRRRVLVTDGMGSRNRVGKRACLRPYGCPRSLRPSSTDPRSSLDPTLGSSLRERVESRLARASIKSRPGFASGNRADTVGPADASRRACCSCRAASPSRLCGPLQRPPPNGPSERDRGEGSLGHWGSATSLVRRSCG